MWRKRSAAVAVIAAVLAVVMATPAVAEGEFTPSEKIVGSGGTNHKYTFDYSSREYVGGNQWSYNSQPVKGEVHPAQTAYERKIAARNAAAAEKPLSGKIIQPGKTVVRIPSTYGPVTKFALGVGAMPGWSRLLGGIGVGIGGTSLAPANRADIAATQGITGGCVVNSVCTADETRKLFLIDSCGQQTGAASCDSIGAVGVTGETDMQKWFKDDALPFLDDLWAKITGQSTNDLPSETHVQINKNWGCSRIIGMEKGPDNTSIQYRNIGHTVDGARPTGTASQSYWDASCSTTALADFAVFKTNIESVCIDPKGSTVGYNGVPYGRSFSGMLANSTGVTGNLCDNAPSNVGAPVLFKARIWNSGTAATDFKGAASPSTQNYEVLKSPYEWINPNPELDTIEDTKITTNWDCRTNDGSYTHSFSKSVVKTAAVVAPVCPPGSSLVKHDVKVDAPGSTGDVTVDGGQEVAGAAAQYPACLGNGSLGCTLDVVLDGQPCTVGKTECHTWPAVNAAQPSRVQCRWGTYTVQTSNCNALSNAYKTETGVVFDPRANTWVAVDAFGTPAAPNPEPWNPTNPNPVVGQTPGTGTTPGPGTGTSPIPGSGASPGTSNNCTAPSWSWNPVEWVYSPVLCALSDAFVPKTDVAAKVAELQGLTTTRPPLNWISPPITGPGGGGCPNWVITLPGVSQNVVCESSFTGAIVGARGALFGLVATAMVWPLMRSIWYAAIPILRVSPGSSK